MSKKLRKTGRKFLSVFLSATTTIAMAGSMVAMPIAASADHNQTHTIEQLSAQIALLQQQLAVLLGSAGGGGAKCTFTRSLKIGVTGNDVKCLQQYLNGAGHQVAASGAGSPGNETTYFGSRTKAAVASWQAANGVSPTAGYFGPISRAKYDMLVVVGPPPPPPGPVPPPPPPGVGTGLTVAAGTQPTASLAPQNAINVPYTRVVFTASADGDVTVNSLTVERTGLMADTALAGAVLLDENGNRLGDQKTLNSDHKAVLNEPFVVKAGTSRTMTIAGDMDSDLAGEAGQVGFLALIAVNTAATVTGSLPITGSGHTVNSSLSLGSVTVARGANDPNATTTKDIGSLGYKFSAIKATAGSAEDILWKSIRWYQSGSIAASDLSNVVVKDTDGNSYSVTLSADGKFYTAILGSGIKIGKGLTKEVYIAADINGGAARTIAFDVWQLEDIVFFGETFKYDVKGTAGTGFTGSQKPRYQGGQVTVGGGSLTVSRASSLTSQNIVVGATQVALGAYEFESKGEPITFKSWAVTITTTDSDAGGENGTLTNITAFNQNGVAIAGPKDPNAKGNTVTFTDAVTLAAGKHTLTLKGNLNTSWENNDTVKTSFTPSSAITTVTGDVSRNTITPSPSSSVDGQTMTVKAGSITIGPASSFATTTVISNATAIEVGRLILDTTASGDDIKITSAKLRKNANSADVVNNVVLKDGTTILNSGSNAVDPSNDGGEDLTFTFDNPYIVTKGVTKTLGIFADISSTATSGGYVKWDLSGGTTNNDWAITTVSQGTDVTETLTTTDAKGVTWVGSGSYSVEADASKPIETWIYAGQSGITLNVLKFKATSEAIALTNLRLQLDVTGSSTGSNFTAVELWDGGTLVQRKDTPSFTNSVEDFTFPISGTGSFVIPKDGNKLITVKADLAPIGIGQTGVAGALVGIDFDTASTTLTGSGACSTLKTSNCINRGVGVQSGTSVKTTTTADQTGNNIVTFRAVPVVRKCNDASGPCAALGTGVGAPATLYRFAVKAVGGDIKLNRVTMKVATSNIATLASSLAGTNGIRWYSVTKGDYVSTATAAVAAFFTNATDKNYDASPPGALIVRLLANNTGTAAVTTNGEYVIPQGVEHVFEVRADAINDDSTAGGSISTILLGDAARPTNVAATSTTNPRTPWRMAKVSMIDVEQGTTACGGTGSAVGFGIGSNAATSTNFIWTDLSSEATSSGNTNSCNTADWMNGFKILPTVGLDSHVLRF